MNLFDLFAHEHRAKRIDQKNPLLALDELIDFNPLVEIVKKQHRANILKRAADRHTQQKLCYALSFLSV